jgi:hypothetical protein
MKIHTSASSASSLLALAACVGVWLSPHVAFACPMCFSGNGVNQSAFLYGSLFLMFLPVTTIGLLVYWVSVRYRAYNKPSDGASEPNERPKAPHVAAPQPLRTAVRR